MAAKRSTTTEAPNEKREFRLRNSRIQLEEGPAGIILRISKDSGRIEYAGPFVTDPDLVEERLEGVSMYVG